MFNIITNDDSVSIVKVVNEIMYSIPTDESNKDYQEYLKWVAEGNEAEEWVSE